MHPKYLKLGGLRQFVYIQQDEKDNERTRKELERRRLSNHYQKDATWELDNNGINVYRNGLTGIKALYGNNPNMFTAYFTGDQTRMDYGDKPHYK